MSNADPVDRLFVYGTLAPGEPNEHVLADLPGTWTAATIRGRLYPEGWGAALGYPALVPDPDGEEIQGQLFQSPQLHAHWRRLDEFEGTAYRRVRSLVQVRGRAVETYVYILRQQD